MRHRLRHLHVDPVDGRREDAMPLQFQDLSTIYPVVMFAVVTIHCACLEEFEEGNQL